LTHRRNHTAIESPDHAVNGQSQNSIHNLANPPFGPVPRNRNAPGGYTGRRFEYHTIAVAASLACRGVFVIPHRRALPVLRPTRIRARPGRRRVPPVLRRDRHQAQAHLRIDTTQYDGEWHGVCPPTEIVMADFTERAQPVALPAQPAVARGRRGAKHGGEPSGQLTLLNL